MEVREAGGTTGSLSNDAGLLVRDGTRTRPLYQRRACDGAATNNETTIDRIAYHRVPVNFHSRILRRPQTMSKLNLISGYDQQFSDEVCIKYMIDADQMSVQSVSFDCGFDAILIRNRFRRTLERCQARRDHRFDGFKFYSPCFSRLVVYLPAPGLSQRDARIRAKGGRRYLVYHDGIILCRSEDDTE